MTRDAAGIARTSSGWRAFVRVKGVLYSRRFPDDASITAMQDWRASKRIRVLTKAIEIAEEQPDPGSFTADARHYLTAVKGMRTFPQREQHINEWITCFGSQSRSSITGSQIAAQLHRWLTEQRTIRKRAKPGHPPKEVKLVLSPSSINKRRSALMHLFTILDGKSGRNPVKDARKFQEPAPAPRAIPFDRLAFLFRTMPRSAARAWLMVIAYTGIPPAQIDTIAETDVDFENLTVAVEGRRKGRGTHGRIVPLSRLGIDAFKAMKRDEGWTRHLSRTVLQRTLRRGCKAVGLGEHWRPYDLRHSFATEVYRRSGDIRAVQVLLDHSTPLLTNRYTLGAVEPRVAAALAALSRRRFPAQRYQAAKR